MIKKVLTEKDIDSLEERFKNTFATKEELFDSKSEIMNGIDKVLSELKVMMSAFLTG